MKKTILIFVALMLLLAGCGQTTGNITFSATIESIQDNSITVTATDDAEFDKASVMFDTETEIPFELMVGQKIEIEALPEVRESYPVQITAVKLSLLEEPKTEYKKITATEAEEMMDEDTVTLDVRNQSEYDQGHIPNAVLLPVSEITQRAGEVLPDKEQVILVYCQSGMRSAQAAEELVDLGYNNVYDFGSIVDWSGGIVQ